MYYTWECRESVGCMGHMGGGMQGGSSCSAFGTERGGRGQPTGVQLMPAVGECGLVVPIYAGCCPFLSVFGVCPTCSCAEEDR